MVRRNIGTPAADARAARLAERRQIEESHFAAADAALATIKKAVGSLDIAVEIANAEIADAADDLVTAVRALTGLGYRMADVAAVLGVDVADLRPGLTLTLRRARRCPRSTNGSTPPAGEAGASASAETETETEGGAGSNGDRAPVDPAGPAGDHTVG